jgi:hypothetical protein
MNTTLYDRRRIAADHEFESYDFSDAIFAGQDGWESDDYSFSKTFYIEEDGSESSRKVSFVVLFYTHSDVVIDASALLCDTGAEFGFRAKPSPKHTP